MDLVEHVGESYSPLLHFTYAWIAFLDEGTFVSKEHEVVDPPEVEAIDALWNWIVLAIVCPGRVPVMDNCPLFLPGVCGLFQVHVLMRWLGVNLTTMKESSNRAMWSLHGVAVIRLACCQLHGHSHDNPRKGSRFATSVNLVIVGKFGGHLEM
jgi:hypothetical protein